MSFCQRAWAATARLQERIVQHPFNQALADGSLPPERFAYYLIQDARYLVSFSAALDAAGRRTGDRAVAQFFAASAQRALDVEGQLHHAYLSRLAPQDSTAVATSGAGAAYAAFLARAAADAPYPVLVASLLPCFWVYHHVGTRILARTGGRPEHPYRAWIDTYADASFAAGVARIRAIADAGAVTHPQLEPAMLAAFRHGSELELAFWDGAWRGR